MATATANPRLQKAFALLEREVAQGHADCGDLGIAIARDGTWTYRGSPIQRPGMVKLFASVLRRTKDGRYWLVTPGERGTVEVADVPFVVVRMQVEGSGTDQRIAWSTNLDETVPLDAAHPLRLGRQPDGSMAPYVMVRDGLEARIGRNVFYDFVELAVEGEAGLGVWSAGMFFPLEPQ